MFYSYRLNDGAAASIGRYQGRCWRPSFNSKRLPYLGLRLCYGGWPSDGEEPLQYAVALEPTTSACNTLAKAQQTNSAISLKAGETYDWEIRFAVKETALFAPVSPA